MQLADDVVQACDDAADVSPESVREELDAGEELSDFVLSVAPFSFGMWERGTKQTLGNEMRSHSVSPAPMGRQRQHMCHFLEGVYCVCSV